MTPANFAKAVALVESDDRSNPPMGDDGRALGRYQMHPDFVAEWAVKLKVTPTLGETWDSYFGRLIQQYFSFRTGQGLTAVQAAVSYHRGHICKENDADWLDDDYAARFADAARSLTT